MPRPKSTMRPMTMYSLQCVCMLAAFRYRWIYQIYHYSMNTRLTRARWSTIYRVVCSMLGQANTDTNFEKLHGMTKTVLSCLDGFFSSLSFLEYFAIRNYYFTYAPNGNIYKWNNGHGIGLRLASAERVLVPAGFSTANSIVYHYSLLWSSATNVEKIQPHLTVVHTKCNKNIHSAR